MFFKKKVAARLRYLGIHLREQQTNFVRIIKNSRSREDRQEMAGREGFEPTLACAKAVFKTAAINHSATYPI